MSRYGWMKIHMLRCVAHTPSGSHLQLFTQDADLIKFCLREQTITEFTACRGRSFLHVILTNTRIPLGVQSVFSGCAADERRASTVDGTLTMCR